MSSTRVHVRACMYECVYVREREQKREKGRVWGTLQVLGNLSCSKEETLVFMVSVFRGVV